MATVRCTNCGKRLPPGTLVCPACGANQNLHIRRIRCNYCSLRVPADSRVCPNCNHNPHGFYIHPRRFLGLIGAAAVIVVGYAALNPSIWVRSIPLPSTPTLTATASPTAIVALVVTATLAPSDTPIPTGTPTPTNPPASTATTITSPTATATQTPTRRTIRVLPSDTPVPTSTTYPSPILFGPPNGVTESGRKQPIILMFTSASGLGPTEWYKVEVIFKSRTFSFANWCGWTKEQFIRFPMSYYDESWQYDRTFKWHVNIAESSANPPSTCAADALVTSPPSAEWTFYWY